MSYAQMLKHNPQLARRLQRAAVAEPSERYLTGKHIYRGTMKGAAK